MAPKNPNSRFRTRLAKPENGDENGGKAMAFQRDININEPLSHNHGWFYVLLIFGHPSHHGNPQTIGSLNNFMGNLKNSYIYICCINIINGFITIPQSWKQPISWRNHRFLRGFAASDAKFWTERIRPRVSVLSRRVSWVQHSWRSSLVRLKILRALPRFRNVWNDADFSNQLYITRTSRSVRRDSKNVLSFASGDINDVLICTNY